MSSARPAEFDADEPTGVSAAPSEVERDLLRRAQRDDRAAYGRLVVMYQDRLYNAILRLVGDRDEARELTQETLTKGLEKIGGFRGDAGPYTWLFRIGMNLAISRLRKTKRHRVFSLDCPGDRRDRRGDGDQASGLVDRLARDPEGSPAEQIERRERDAEVLAALGRLDAESRAVLVMRDIEGFDYRQMAEILALPLGTLKSRLFRARLALREELKSYLG